MSTGLAILGPYCFFGGPNWDLKMCTFFYLDPKHPYLGRHLNPMLLIGSGIKDVHMFDIILGPLYSLKLNSLFLKNMRDVDLQISPKLG